MSDLARIIDNRLGEIGCERLPASVKTKLLEDISADVESYARKRAARLTANHVARAFKAAFIVKKGASPGAVAAT